MVFSTASFLAFAGPFPVWTIIFVFLGVSVLFFTAKTISLG